MMTRAELLKTRGTQDDPGRCNNELESSRMTEMAAKAAGILGMHVRDAGEGTNTRTKDLVRS